MKQISALVVGAMAMLALGGCGISESERRSCARSAQQYAFLKEQYDAGVPRETAEAEMIERGFATLPDAAEFYAGHIYEDGLTVKEAISSWTCSFYNPPGWSLEALVAYEDELTQASIAEQEAERAKSAPPKPSPAQQLCDTFEMTGLLSEPCRIDHLLEVVSVTLDMASAAEAREVCPTARQTSDFGAGSGWTLKIFSPYSGDSPLATCRL